MVSFASTIRAAFTAFCLVIIHGIAEKPGTIRLTAQSALLTGISDTLQATTGTP